MVNRFRGDPEYQEDQNDDQPGPIFSLCAMNERGQPPGLYAKAEYLQKSIHSNSLEGKTSARRYRKGK